VLHLTAEEPTRSDNLLTFCAAQGNPQAQLHVPSRHTCTQQRRQLQVGPSLLILSRSVSVPANDAKSE